MARRIPRTRTGYAVAAALVAVPMYALFTIAIYLIERPDASSLFDSIRQNAGEALLFTFGPAALAAFSAWVCWPRGTLRTRRRMAVAGVATVAMAYLLLGAAFGAVEFFESGRDLRAFGEAVAFALWVGFAGSVLMLGAPYLAGATASLAFANVNETPRS